MQKDKEATPNLTPKQAWFELCKLRAESNRLYAEGDKLYAEGRKLYAEGNKLRAEGNKLRAEGDKLYAEGDKLYAEGRLIFCEAVIAAHGPKAIMHLADEGFEVEGKLFKYGEPI
jgi:hypothetical protein